MTERTPRLADPGLIGLLGFVIATLTAQLEHLGLQNESPVFWVGAVFGGVVQVTAGMLSYFAGDDFHFIVYNAFGWYWICMPGFLLGGELGFFEVEGPARGVFTLMFAILALVFALSAASRNTVLPVTLLAVAAGLGLQTVTAFGGPATVGAAGSVALLLASALAAYMLLEKFYARTLGRSILPLGPAWFRTASPVSIQAHTV
ncbi:acetate uptake transporter family protein [Microbacterium arborescens]|jgi:succinate-acetate transporter protein|uniref:acetate uptake transporter family protein n=1 Tax=Microbacterium TaxID=33882 RepID=UPI0025A1B2AC|nr:GPR1/FUN34/YaaH family transporter [Microbacterium arborescens]WJM14839.1 GPR1/FUN34/YaaH family transporter [Microbacterium arborescens]